VSKEGQVVGEGFHPRAGEPHAEIFALRQAGSHAEGSTVYVSLEPCNHYGRTPPCSMALQKVAVARVVVGMVDPDPRTRGDGIAFLRRHGIRVDMSELELECRKLNEGFCRVKEFGRPYGTWKYAMTLDGKIATDSGNSRWISSTSSREWVHDLRSKSDAIIIGGNTVRRDNPTLNVRLDAKALGALRPLRVVMSRSLDLNENSRIFDVALGETVLLAQRNDDPRKHAKVANLRGRGVEVEEFETLEPRLGMEYLASRGVMNVLWECGGRLSAEAVRQGCIQRLHAFVSPKLVGGDPPHVNTPMNGVGILEMSHAISLKNVEIDRLGPDLLISADLPDELC